jgi:hypothetical protein
MALPQLGTLGTGNHFVELCLDETDRLWAMLHSGSRGIGNRIGTWFIEQAKAEAERHGVELLDRDLAWLPEGTDLFADYVEARSHLSPCGTRRRPARSAPVSILHDRRPSPPVGPPRCWPVRRGLPVATHTPIELSSTGERLPGTTTMPFSVT